MLISLVSGLFSSFEKGSSVRGIFLRQIGTFCLMARRLLISKISAPRLFFYLLKVLITATTAVTVPVFTVSIVISLALVVSLGAVLATLIGRGSVYK
jgi:hypothetical protein